MLPSRDNDDINCIMRFVRAIALVLLALATFIVTLAMFWRDAGIDSILESWFGQWSDTKLTVVAGIMIVASLSALRAVQQSDSRYKRRPPDAR